MALQVIGAGFGRTGTSSLQVALERLGFAPCDHMGEVFKHPERAALWMEAARAKARGQAFDWECLYGYYAATTDWPGAYFWRELADAYPDAKVILTVREPERWYESMLRTIWPLRQDPALRRRMAAAVGLPSGLGLDWMPRLVDTIVFDATFGGRFEDRAHALTVFEAHAAAVEAAIPPERLLVFAARDGWGPLCRFLGVSPEPPEPFPHVNGSASLAELLAAPTTGEPAGAVAARPSQLDHGRGIGT